MSRGFVQQVKSCGGTFPRKSPLLKQQQKPKKNNQPRNPERKEGPSPRNSASTQNFSALTSQSREDFRSFLLAVALPSWFPPSSLPTKVATLLAKGKFAVHLPRLFQSATVDLRVRNESPRLCNQLG